MIRKKPKTKKVRKPVARYLGGMKMWTNEDHVSFGYENIGETHIFKDEIDRVIKFLIKAEKYFNQGKKK